MNRLNTFVETENIRTRLGEEEARIVLEKRIEVLEGKFTSMLETMSTEMKELKEIVQQERLTAPALGQEFRVEAPKPSIFKGIRDAQEVENFLWQLEKYFKRNKIGIDNTKIETAEVYLLDTTLLWWRRVRKSRWNPGFAPFEHGSSSRRSSRGRSIPTMLSRTPGKGSGT